MKTFAARLKFALEKLDISQAEAARRCGISQQSINYIISNDLKQSKLAPTIASTLDINPEWLIYGEGRFKETKYYEIPVFENAYGILKYLNHDLDLNSCKFIVVDLYLGNLAFAYLAEPHKLAICCENEYNLKPLDYLNLSGLSVKIDNRPLTDLAYGIIEWRIRLANFQFS